MIKVKYKKLNDLAKKPEKKHDKDFCYDVYATSCRNPEPGLWEYGIGLAFEIDRCDCNAHVEYGYPGLDKLIESKEVSVSIDFRPRSSVKDTGLILSNCEGTVDEIYRGEVVAYFYEVLPGKQKYKVGDRIGQIKLGITIPMDFEEVDELNMDTERGTGGFGSTGR